MADFINTINSAFSGSKTIVWTFGLMLIIGAIAILLLFVAFLVWYYKRRWNLKVEIKLPRGDGKITVGEWGKGLYDAKKGVCYIKRPKQYWGNHAMPIFDIKKYLQGTDLLTVIQVGPEDYRPVLNDSYTEHIVNYVNEETGEEKEIKESIINIKIDTALNKAWKSSQSMMAKKAYSLQSFFTQFQTPIAIAIVLIACFVGFAMLWARIG